MLTENSRWTIDDQNNEERNRQTSNYVYFSTNRLFLVFPSLVLITCLLNSKGVSANQALIYPLIRSLIRSDEVNYLREKIKYFDNDDEEDFDTVDKNSYSESDGYLVMMKILLVMMTAI